MADYRPIEVRAYDDFQQTDEDMDENPDLVEALDFITDTWNSKAKSSQFTAKKYLNMIKLTTKYLLDTKEWSINDAIITIFTEFFFCPYDDGKHSYAYYYKRFDSDVYHDSIRVYKTPEQKHEDEERFKLMDKKARRMYSKMNPDFDVFSPMPVGAHFNPCDSEATYPCGTLLRDDGHFISRSLFKLMVDAGLIPVMKSEVNDPCYNDNAYLATDYIINPKPTKHITDPFGLIERGEVHKLWASIEKVIKFVIDKYGV